MIVLRRFYIYFTHLVCVQDRDINICRETYLVYSFLFLYKNFLCFYHSLIFFSNDDDDFFIHTHIF